MSKGKLPKIQHYVPKLILRNFSIDDTDQLFVFDKSTGEVFKSNISNITQLENFKIKSSATGNKIMLKQTCRAF